MKKILAAVMTVVAFMSMLSSCSDSTKEEKKTAAPAKKTAVAPEETLPNYRYVDLDTLLSKYNLAKDYNEEIIRMQNSMEQEIKRLQEQTGKKRPEDVTIEFRGQGI